MLYVCNVDEAAIGGNALTRARWRSGPRPRAPAASSSRPRSRPSWPASSPRSAPTTWSSSGLEEPGLNALIREGYRVLDLITFFTVGPKEARAWTVTAGTKAPKAAGAIHTDFEKGFIRAETIAYDDYVALGGERPAKEAGKMRLEGKEYVVKDGDVMPSVRQTQPRPPTASARFDDLVGASEQRWRYRDTERGRSLEVDRQRELRWALDRQVAWFRALENPIEDPAMRRNNSARLGP